MISGYRYLWKHPYIYNIYIYITYIYIYNIYIYIYGYNQTKTPTPQNDGVTEPNVVFRTAGHVLCLSSLGWSKWWEKPGEKKHLDIYGLVTTVDGRNPIPNHLGCIGNPVNNGISYQPQLLQDFFHQQNL